MAENNQDSQSNYLLEEFEEALLCWNYGGNIVTFNMSHNNHI